MSAPVIPISTGIYKRRAQAEEVLADLTRLHKDIASLGFAYVAAIEPDMEMGSALCATAQILAIARKHLAEAVEAARGREAAMERGVRNGH